MTGAVNFAVKIFTEASASVASMVVTALPVGDAFSQDVDMKPERRTAFGGEFT